MARDGAHVDDGALHGGHECSAHDGHDEEGGTERGVLALDIFQGYAIDGGEHERHEGRYAYEAVQAWHAHDEDGTCGT